MTMKRIGLSIILCVMGAILLFISPNIQAANPKQIQLFDISKGKVVREMDNTKIVQEEILKILESIDGIVPTIHIDPKDGFVVRIPVSPEVEVSNEWFDDKVKEVFMIIPRSEKPSMLVFTIDKKPIVMTFKHDLTALLTQMDLLKETDEETHEGTGSNL